jgi:restriction system protein
MWEKRIQHEGLHAFRVVRGHTKEETELKARLQLEAWNASWKRKLEQKAAAEKRLSKQELWERQVDVDRRSKAFATERTVDAENQLYAVRNLLIDALTKKQIFDWDSLQDKSHFDKPAPPHAQNAPLPPEPQRSDPQFVVLPVTATLKMSDWIIPGRRQTKVVAAQTEQLRAKNDAERRYAQLHAEWKVQCDEIHQSNKTIQSNYSALVEKWTRDGAEFSEQQKEYNRSIANLHAEYLRKSPDALIRYWHEVLTRSVYPESFPRDCSLSFDADSAVLVLDYELPNHAALPNKRQIKYVATRGEFHDVLLSDSDFKRLYDDVLYQICLRTLYELFQADDVNAIGSIVFNGWVRSIDKATGADTHPCVMSVQISRDEFMALNLAQVDLKVCFRALKGISGGRLVDLAPVRPVLTLNTNDRRFVEPYNVAGTLDEKTNLAAMDWLDFENLIRELFEKEFQKNGGQVKITQASRDGGVDAIAFDPDPLRGGKIVIQAKRYTNTVGVSAVRDLYGTVHNEGATKGILVTTSDYGPDAYEFAKGKPLTLLSGSELLYLLGLHGYAAKIDMREARKILEEKDR